jgi:hypothetical protein
LKKPTSKSATTSSRSDTRPRGRGIPSLIGVDQGVLSLICQPANRQSPPRVSLLGSPRCRALARPHCFSLTGSRPPLASPPRRMMARGFRSFAGRDSPPSLRVLTETSGVGRSLPQPRLTPLQSGASRGRDRHRQRGGTPGSPGSLLSVSETPRPTRAPPPRPSRDVPVSGPVSFSKTTTPEPRTRLPAGRQAPEPGPAVRGTPSIPPRQRPARLTPLANRLKKGIYFQYQSMTAGRHRPPTVGREDRPLFPRRSATVRMRREGRSRITETTLG